MRNNSSILISAIIIPIIASLVGILLGYVDKQNIIYVTILLFMMSISTIIVVSLLTSHLIKSSDISNHVDKLNLLHNRMKNYVKGIDKNPYLSCSKELVLIEKKAKEIWVITPDFYWDYEDKVYSSIVKDNIKSGKTYWYIFPKDDIIFPKAVDFKNTFDSKVQKNIHLVPVKYDFLLFINEIVVYDPNEPNSNYHCGFLTNLVERGKNSIDIKLKEKKTLPGYKNLFNNLISNNSELINSGT